MEDEVLVAKIQELSDLELASLLCLAAREHCIIYTDPEALNSLADELTLVASRVFGLSFTVVDCSHHTTPDDFAGAIQRQARPPAPRTTSQSTQDHFLHNSTSGRSYSTPPRELAGDGRDIANVIIAKNLDQASNQVQIQAFDLLRTGRIYTRVSVLATPKRFLFISLLSSPWEPKLVKHLNDHFFISHFHGPEDGFPNIEEEDDRQLMRTPTGKRGFDERSNYCPEPVFSLQEVDALVDEIERTTVSVEVEGYLQNIVSFLRLHRAVSGGISTVATKHFGKLIRCLAPLHGLSYVTPSLVALAAKKIYPHRITIVTPENDRSVQWGSDVEAVASMIEGLTPEDVVNDVVGMVDVPV